MKRLALLIALTALQSCGTYCGAQKFRNSNKYYGATIDSNCQTLQKDMNMVKIKVTIMYNYCYKSAT